MKLIFYKKGSHKWLSIYTKNFNPYILNHINENACFLLGMILIVKDVMFLLYEI